MPCICQIDESARLGTLKLSGRIAIDDLTQALTELYTHPRWQPDYLSLWDARGITELIISPNDVEAFLIQSAPLRSRIGPGRTAIVAPRDLDNITARLFMHRTAHPQRERKVFIRMEPALEWLLEASAE